MRAAFAAVTLAFALGGVATGCSVVPGPSRPDWRVFTLQPDMDATVSAAEAGGRGGRPVVVVGIPGSGAGYATRRMAYTRGGGELEYFAAHRWTEPPARLLGPLLQAELERTGRFRAVAAAPTRARGDLVIESELHAFRQEVEEDAATFHATLRVTVLRSGAPAEFVSRVFDVMEPMPAPGPGEGVRAANRAVAALLRNAADFCVEASATLGESVAGGHGR